MILEVRLNNLCLHPNKINYNLSFHKKTTKEELGSQELHRSIKNNKNFLGLNRIILLKHEKRKKEKERHRKRGRV